MSSYDVIVLGAGLSGLSAAREIQKRAPQLKVKVLEAKDRVGGRLLTCSIRTLQGTDQWDLGGQWVGKTQTELLDLIQELNLKCYKQYTEGKKLAQIGGTKIRSYDTTLPTNSGLQYSPMEALDFVKTIYRLEKMSQELDYLNPFGHPAALEWDAQSVEDWVHRNCYTNTMRDSIELAARAVLGQSANRVSLLYLLLYGRAAGSISNLLETTEDTGAQGFKVKGGTQQICRLISDDLGDQTVLLQHAVYSVEQINDAVCVRVRIGEGDGAKLSSLTCQRLIIALPPNQSSKIEFLPPLPDAKRQLIDGFPQGNLVKFIVTYPKPFWRDLGLSGETAAAGLNHTAGERRALCVSFDACTEHGNAALVGFVHNEWADEDKATRRDAVLKDLAKFFGSSALGYIDYEDKAWCFEPYSGGCPVSSCPPGNTKHFINIRQIDGKIHWAGTEAAVHWPGYMCGAIESGVRAANECLNVLAPDAVDETKLIKQQHTLKPDYSYKTQSALCKLTKYGMLVCAIAAGAYYAKKRFTT